MRMGAVNVAHREPSDASHVMSRIYYRRVRKSSEGNYILSVRGRITLPVCHAKQDTISQLNWDILHT